MSLHRTFRRSHSAKASGARRAVLVALCLVLPLTLAGTAQADWAAGVAAFQAGQLQEAVTQFRAVAEEKPDWYGGHYMLGAALMKLDRAEDAYASLERAYGIETRPDVALVLADVALDLGRDAKVREVLAAAPADALPAQHKVKWLRLRGQAASSPADALRAYEAALAVDGSDAGLRALAGGAALDAKQYQRAIEHLKAARRTLGDDAAVLARLVKAELAVAEASQGSQRTVLFADAADTARALAKVSPAAEYQLVAGRALLGADQPAAAEPYLERAAAGTGTWLAAHELARARLDQQRWTDAQKALAAFTDVADAKAKAKIHVLLGRALEGQQLFDDAIAAYEVAGDQDGVAHAKEGREAKRHNDEVARIKVEMDRVQCELEGVDTEGNPCPDAGGNEANGR